MKILRKYVLTMMFLLPFLGLAQNIKVTGIVTNEDDEPLIGASVKVADLNNQTQTDEKGYFEISLPADRFHVIIVSYQNREVKKPITVASEDINGLRIIIFNKTLGPVEIREVRASDFMDGFPPVELNRIASPSQNFEDIIKSAGLGVNSNNELTANYNVRGGNYDENLIYVNGIQIYRPFLARSGQQEGLSFINPAFVENIFFSAGGFDAYYGDKLSSVLDIRYREPLGFAGSAQMSLMGAQAHIENNFAGRRGNFITGARYRANSYVLNSLPTQGDYNPTFFDYQMLVNFYLNYDNPGSYTKWFTLGHFSTNNYRFEPTSRSTSWGTVNEAYQLRVFFEGQEETKFQTFTAATGIETYHNDRLKMTFVGSVFRSIESEHFDILSEYWINELETDPSKEEFGDSTSNVGVGGLLDQCSK